MKSSRAATLTPQNLEEIEEEMQITPAKHPKKIGKAVQIVPLRSTFGVSRPLVAADRRALVFKAPKKVDFLSNCICTHATGSKPPEHETCEHDAAAACIRMQR